MQRKCPTCKKRKAHSTGGQCFRCCLLSGPSLSIAFASIITQPDMETFDHDMNDWYPVMES